MRKLWETQGTLNPHAAAHFGLYVFKPQSPLSLIDHGVDPYTGIVVPLEAHQQNQFKYRPAQDADSLMRFGDLTPSVLLFTLLPLVVILLGFNAITEERESGTLRQLLSVGVSGRMMVAGKAGGLALAMASLLAPALLMTWMALQLATSWEALVVALPQMAALLMVAAAYLAIFIGLTLGVSLRASNSRQALAVLLAIWTVTTLVAPRLAADLSAAILPAPSTLEFERQIARDLEQGIDGHNPASQRAERLKQQLLVRYGVGSVQELPVNFSGVLLQEGENYGNRVFDHRFGQLWDRYQEQQRLTLAGSVISPSMAARGLVTAFAGTDFGHFRDFASAAESYRRLMIKRLNDDLINSKSSALDYTRDGRFWKAMPAFTYEAPSLGWTLKRVWPACLWLLMWLAAAWWFAWSGVRRVEE